MTDTEKRLSDEDMARVEEYLSLPANRVERKPFRPLLLLFWLWVIVSLLGGIAYFFAWMIGAT